MQRTSDIANSKIKRKLRARKNIVGTAEKPRLSVYRSNKYTYCQAIDDTTGKTLATAFNLVKETHVGKNKVAAAFDLGEKFAKVALEKKITKVVFDRNGYRYHGRVASLAEGARKGGLEF